MTTTKITRKGQVRIPRPVRESLRLKSGDRVEFVLQDDDTALMVPASVHVADIEAMLPPPERPVSLKKMERAIRRRGAGR